MYRTLHVHVTLPCAAHRKWEKECPLNKNPDQGFLWPSPILWSKIALYRYLFLLSRPPYGILSYVRREHSYMKTWKLFTFYSFVINFHLPWSGSRTFKTGINYSSFLYGTSGVHKPENFFHRYWSESESENFKKFTIKKFLQKGF